MRACAYVTLLFQKGNPFVQHLNPRLSGLNIVFCDLVFFFVSSLLQKWVTGIKLFSGVIIIIS